MKNNIIFLASANFPDNIFGRRQRQLLGTPVKQPLCSLRFNSHAADAQPKIRGKLICSQCQTLFAVKVVVGNHKPPHRRHHRRARRNGNRPPALSEQVLQFMFYLVEFLFDVHA